MDADGTRCLQHTRVQYGEYKLLVLARATGVTGTCG
jgi:hypothetical protein